MTQKELRKRISRGISLILGAFWATFTITFGQLFGIRLGVIDARNIGHLALFPELALMECFAAKFQRNFKQTYWEIIFPASNIYLLSLWADYFQIRRSFFGIKSACGLLNYLGLQRLTISTQNYYGSSSVSRGEQPLHSVSFDAKRRALSLLKAHVSGADFDRLVCLHVRDGEFDRRTKGVPSVKAHNDPRNADFISFLSTVQVLCERDFVVCLMGTHNHDVTMIRHNNFISLQEINESQDPSIDITLISQCSFYISGSVSGLYEVARLFRKPVLYCNYFSYMGLPIIDKRSIVLPRQIVEKSSGAQVPLLDVFDYLDEIQAESVRLKRNGFDAQRLTELTDRPEWQSQLNSEPQILAACQEFLHYRASGFRAPSDLQAENLAFLQAMPSFYDKALCEIRIAGVFLQSYQQELLSLTESGFGRREVVCSPQPTSST